MHNARRRTVKVATVQRVERMTGYVVLHTSAGVIELCTDAIVDAIAR